MIYKLNDNYLKNYEPGKLLERAKARRFIIVSNPDKYGSVRVWELGMSRRTTYHISFLEEDESGQYELRRRIFDIIGADYTADYTKGGGGHTKVYLEKADLIMAEVNNYITSLCAPDKQEEMRR